MSYETQTFCYLIYRSRDNKHIHIFTFSNPLQWGGGGITGYTRVTSITY